LNGYEGDRVKVEEGFLELYQREFPAVYRAAFVLSGDRDLAEEATQEAFARALARWNRLGEASWVAGWVTTTALNLVKRHKRRAPDQTTVPRPADDTGQDLDASVDLWRAVRLLPRRQREAVALHYLMDLSVQDSATAMGCSEGTVKAHLSRARASIERELAGTRGETAKLDEEKRSL
jgi:RNA polymerase sigma factor (sigma-70 family)